MKSVSPKPVDAAPALHPMIVVGGTLHEWEALADDQWDDRIAELGKVADHVGARWLVLRPFEGASIEDVFFRAQFAKQSPTQRAIPAWC